MNNYPERLTNDAYLNAAPIRVYAGTRHGRVSLHWHEFYEMSLIASGTGIHTLNGAQFPLVPGSLFLLTPADFHELVSHDGSSFEILNVIFTEEALTEDIRQLLFGQTSPVMHVLEGESFERIKQDYYRLWQEANEREIGYSIALKATLQRMLVDAARRNHLASERLGQQNETPLQQAIRMALIYIQHHFREPLTLKEAAGQAGLSATYFSECFRKITGTTFQHYLQAHRLQFAKSLIQASELPITEICFISGFNTLSHFERAFKQKFRQSPRDCRSSGRN